MRELYIDKPNVTHKYAYEYMRRKWIKEMPKNEIIPGALFHGDTFEEFLEVSQKIEKGGYELPEATTFFLMENRKIIGGINIRHKLSTSRVAQYSGHIGYGIAPSKRNNGYGTKLLSFGLEQAKKIGINHVLIYCLSNNSASKKVIQKNGGYFEKEIKDDKRGNISRYYIKI